jgi:hypothetical protein
MGSMHKQTLHQNASNLLTDSLLVRMTARAVEKMQYQTVEIVGMVVRITEVVRDCAEEKMTP